tara:strand:+ start:197 stop:1195 length:999 start_codon:yes stop_codon:yes gene_type:complete
MGPLAKFLLSLTNLVRSGAIKKIPDAIKFAKQEFGEVTPLLKKQIENVFSKIKKPEIGKPGKKEGTVLPFIKDKAPGEGKGLESLEEFRLSDDDPMGDLEQILNPRRPGGSLDQATGLTRTLARRILDRKGIEIGKKDPIDVFIDIYGESITDVKNLAEEMIEIDQRGGGMKDMDQMLEIEGLFDIEIPANPNKGLTDEEMLELMKKTEEEEIIKNFDPTNRKPNAGGGIMRTNLAMGNPLPEDPTKPVNPFAPKPTGPVLPNKMASGPDLEDSRNELSLKLFGKELKLLTPEELDLLNEEAERLMQKYSSKQKKAPSIKLAGGGLAYLMGM